jgi:ABC-type branched-subunit amino acid transport system substrate-binding protein
MAAVLLAVLAACNAQTSQSPQRVQVPAGQLNPIPPGAPPLASVPPPGPATPNGALPQPQLNRQAGLMPPASSATGQSRFQPIPQGAGSRRPQAAASPAEREDELSEFSLDRKLAQQGIGGEETSLRDNRFAAPPPPPVSSSIPRVAILLPLSGQHAALGQAMLNAAQLALFHFADKSFELLPHDTRGTPQGAADAASLAIGDGAALILGPLFSSSVDAVKPAAEAAGLSVISFSNDQRVSGGNVFTMGFRPEEQVSQVVRYAFGKGLRRFALLAPDNSYGQTVVEALGNTVSQLGAEIADTAFYDPFANDFEPLIRRLAD